ncbi:MAG: TlpA family protein disulfide reductase [Streptosporangiaceae bacterium]|jgi:cytochrome c biogenesis protein CcmG/thiol:disulfide interchange protein DsbE
MTRPVRAIFPVAVALAALLAGGCSSSGSQAGGETGSSGPKGVDGRDFALHELRDPAARISMASYAGQPVIVSFFASWCPACQQETQTIAEYYRFNHRHDGHVHVIGVDPADQRGAALSLIRRDKVTFPVVTDQTMATATAFGAPGLPATYFLNAEHHVVRKILGPVTWLQLTQGVARMNSSSTTAASPAA